MTAHSGGLFVPEKELHKGAMNTFPNTYQPK